MENAEGKLKTKLTQLEIHAKRTEQVLDSGSVEAIERHKGALKTTTKTPEAEKLFKCPIIGPIQVIKCPHPRETFR